MGQKIINIRGYVFAVQSASGSQLAFQKRMYEQRTDEELEKYHHEYLSDSVRGSVTDDLKGP